MPDTTLLNIAGAAIKPSKYSELYTAKFVGGLQTQRSPLMSLATRYDSRYLGGRADALIAGSNVELNNKLLWQRRPGLLQYGTSSIPAPSFFFPWQQSQTANFISAVDPLNTGVPYPRANLSLIIDTLTNGTTAPGNIYNYSPTNSGIILNKSILSRQTSLIDVVSTMYLGDGVDLYKVVGANLLTQSNNFSNAAWGTTNTTFTTEQVDPTGGTNATQFVYSSTSNDVNQSVTPNYTPVASNTFTFSVWLKATSPGQTVHLILEDQVPTVIGSTNLTLTTSWALYQITGVMLNSSTSVSVHINGTANTTAINVYGAQLEVGGPATPTIITTTKPLGVYLWGIQAPTTAPTFTTTPQTGTTGLPWQPNHNYSTTTFTLTGVAATSNSVAVYSGTISGGAANAFAGFYFSVSGFTNAANNSVAPGFICTASTATTLTLNNLSAVNETHAATATKLDTIVDTNGNLEVAYTPGKSGSTQPVWNVVQGGATQDGLQNIVVQNTSAISSNGTVSVAFPSNVTATDTKLIFIATRAPGSIVVTDSSGDVPVLLTSQTTRDFKIYAYYVLSAAGGASTISVSNGGASGTWLGIAETVNQTATDGSASNGSFNSTNSLFLTGSVTTTNAIDLIISFGLFSNSLDTNHEQGNLPFGFQGMVSQAATSVGPNGGSAGAFWNMAVGYEVLLATASVNPQWTITNVSTGSTLLMGITGAFKSSVGSLVWYNVGQTAATGLSPRIGYTYYYSFVNTYTGHRSNVSPLSATTGVQTGVAINVSGMGMQITPSGPANQDPQVDAIEVYRNQDGGGFWYQIPPSLMTNPSATIVGADGKTYLANPGTANSPGTWSFSDKVLDSQLNTQIFAPVGFLNSPPPAGLTNLEFWDGRLWGSVGGTLYYATAADDATLINVVQNGVSAESWEPTNTIPFNSPLVRSVATGGGLLVNTTTDIWGVVGQNLATYQPIKLFTGVGLGNYNAICIDGSTMMLITRDRQCLMLNVSSGLQEIGFVIGDLIESSINPLTCYLARHVKGSQDNAFYLGDGATGWFRLNPNMFGASTSGEQTPIWSPFATIASAGGAGAIASIEVQPGIKQLLVGGTGSTFTGPILNRDINTFSDNGSLYTWSETFGSFVLAEPGKLAEMESITTEMTAASATQCNVAVIINEISGTFEDITNSGTNPTPDPPGYSASQSVLSNRFYLSPGTIPPIGRHMQTKLSGKAAATKDELLSLTVRGALVTEQS